MSLRQLLNTIGFPADSSRVDELTPAGRDYMRLEERVVFSGSPLGDVVDLDGDGVDSSLDSFGHDPDLGAEPVSGSFEAPLPPPQDASPNSLSGSQSVEVIFVDTSTDDYERLVEDLVEQRWQKSFEVVLIDSTSDGVTQITDALRQFDELDAIHIISHGSDGQVQLGNVVLNVRALPSYAAGVASWGEALQPGGDILWYGCDLAASERGIELLESVSELAQADVAASDDLTGHKSLGGDWELEYATGAIDTSVAVSLAAQARWVGTLDAIAVTTTQDVLDGDTSSLAALAASPGADGSVSLREAIVAANQDAAADEIVLGSGAYILSIAGSDEGATPDAAIGDLDILHELSIRGAGPTLTTILGGATGERVFHVFSVDDVQIARVGIEGGEGDGGAIRTEAGTLLTLLDSSLENNGNNLSATGGALAIFGDASVTNVTLANNGNIASTLAGGAIWVGATGDVTLDYVLVQNNSAQSGGGVYNEGNLQVSDSWFHANQADGATGRGGGIWNSAGASSLVVERVTLSNNQAGDGGALYVSANATVSNSTITNNLATNGGGGIANAATLNIVNSTISYNQVGGGAASTGIDNTAVAATLGLQNTILFENDHAGNSVVTGGGNLATGTVSGFGGLDSELVASADFELQPLAFNGGPTPTHAILSTSVAADAGVVPGTPLIDQRGFSRIAAPDSGAFEVAGANPIASDDSFSVTEGTVFAGEVLSNDSILHPDLVTSNLTLQYFAGLDMPPANVWEDQTGLAGFDFNIPAGATRAIGPTNSPPGITAAYDFDGTGGASHGDSFQSLPGDPTNDSASFEFWLRPSDPTLGREVIFDSGWMFGGASLILDGATTPGQQLLRFTVVDGLHSLDVGADVTGEVASGEYLHVVAVVDVVTGTAELYVDGALEDTDTNGSVTDWTSNFSGAATGIGGPDSTVATPLTGLSAFDGEVAGFQFYETDLDATDVSQNFAAMNDLALSPAPQVVTTANGVSVTLASDGSFSYDPGNIYDYLQVGESIADSFTYSIATSNGNVDTGTVALTVNGINNEEVLVTNRRLVVDEGGVGAISQALLDTSDVDNPPAQLIYTVSPAHGQVELTTAPLVAVTTFTQDDVNNNRVLYRHNGDELATDDFAFTVDDGQGTVTNGVFGVDVSPINDAPSISLPPDQDVSENTDLVLSTASGNAIQVADNDAGTSPILLRIATTTGTLSLVPTPGLTFVQGDGVDDPVIIIRGAQDAVNAALDGLTYRPFPLFLGVTTIDFTVNDLGNSGTPGPLGATESLTVEVHDTPDAVDDRDYEVTVGQVLIAINADNVLQNDQFTFLVGGPTLVSGPGNGTLVWNDTGSFVYIPDDGFVGTDSFVYRLTGAIASDDATVSIEVVPAPIPDPDPTDPPTPDDPRDPSVPDIPPLPSQEFGLGDDPDEGVFGGLRSVEVVDPVSTTQESLQTDEVTSSDAAQATRREAGRSRGETTFEGQELEFIATGALALAGTPLDEGDPVSLDIPEDELFHTMDAAGWYVPGIALTGGLSIGWLLWLKSAYIISSLLSTASPWTMIDPLPVLDSLESTKSDDSTDVDELETMVE